MRSIQLTKGLIALVDDVDFDLVSRWKWRAKKHRSNWIVYRSAQYRGVGYTVTMSRLIMKAPDGVLVDHWDGDGLNNQRHNLRFCTNQQNQHNQRHLRSDNTSGYKGVTFWRHRGIFNAQIYVNKVRKNLGYYPTAEEAAAAYDEAAKHYFGDFAATNREIRK